MTKTVIQLLNIEPNHDEIAVFREVININGYKVLSEDLAPIVNAITEQWWEDEIHPTHKDQLEGT